jgi:hypothetical protein
MYGYEQMLTDLSFKDFSVLQPLLGRRAPERREQVASPSACDSTPLLGRSAAASDRPEQRAK